MYACIVYSVYIYICTHAHERACVRACAHTIVIHLQLTNYTCMTFCYIKYLFFALSLFLVHISFNVKQFLFLFCHFWRTLKLNSFYGISICGAHQTTKPKVSVFECGAERGKINLTARLSFSVFSVCANVHSLVALALCFHKMIAYT